MNNTPQHQGGHSPYHPPNAPQYGPTGGYSPNFPQQHQQGGYVPQQQGGYVPPGYHQTAPAPSQPVSIFISVLHILNKYY